VTYFGKISFSIPSNNSPVAALAHIEFPPYSKIPNIQERLIRKNLNTIIRTRKTLGIHLYQTRMPIHDRFILTESDNINSGLAMGTSFNSLGNHHYCIYKLGHSTTQIIWNELESWIKCENNLVKDGEV